MTNLRKAAEMALEAIEPIVCGLLCEASHHVKKDRHDFASECPIEQRFEKAREALRQALAQQDSDCKRCKGVGCVACDSRQILAQPEQEQVDWEAVSADQAMTIAMMKIESKRKWVGLTEDDKHFLLANAWNKEQAFDGFMEAIDKFLEEKNT